MAKIKNIQRKQLTISQINENQKALKNVEKLSNLEIDKKLNSSEIELGSDSLKPGVETSIYKDTTELSTSQTTTESTLTEVVYVDPIRPRISTNQKILKQLKHHPIKPIRIEKSSPSVSASLEEETSNVEDIKHAQQNGCNVSVQGSQNECDVGILEPQLGGYTTLQPFFSTRLLYIGLGLILVGALLAKGNQFFHKIYTFRKVKLGDLTNDPPNFNPFKLPGCRQKKNENDKIIELKVVSPFCIGTPVLLCKHSIYVEKGEVGEIVEILDFDRVLVDFTKPFIFKSMKNNQIINLKKLASQIKSEAIILTNL